jgi:hypothetical protein
LDIDLFRPLKGALLLELHSLLQTEVLRVQKSEWLKAFVGAQRDAFIIKNVLSGWRGAGLLPFDPE